MTRIVSSRWNVIAVALILALPQSLVAAQTPTASFDQRISDLHQKTLPQATLGMVVLDPESNQVLYARREREYFYPASNTKLFTASAALHQLGPDFQYHTSLRAKPGAIQNGVLQGDLHVVFTGDPSFTSADLKALMQQLSTQHITQITGNVVIDDTAYQGTYYGPGWTHDSIIWAYSAPVSPIIIDENKVVVSLDKPKSVLDIIPIRKQRSDHPAELTTKVVAATREAAKNQCHIQVNTQNNHIMMEGCYALEDTPTILELAIDSPRQLAQKYIEKALSAQKIALGGKVRFGSTPVEYPPLAVKYSPPLKSLLVPVLRDSNNLYAETITKTMGLAMTQKGTFQSGTLAIKTALEQQAGLPPAQYRLSDGSGQSRYNLVSPLLISQLLYAMSRSPHFEHYHNALSVGGVRGTLSNVMKTDLKGKVFAKTGGASGTSTLSGYIIADNGKAYIFSILLNQINSDNYFKARQFQESICQMIAKEAWPSSAINDSQTQLSYSPPQ